MYGTTSGRSAARRRTCARGACGTRIHRSMHTRHAHAHVRARVHEVRGQTTYLSVCAVRAHALLLEGAWELVGAMAGALRVGPRLAQREQAERQAHARREREDETVAHAGGTGAAQRVLRQRVGQLVHERRARRLRLLLSNVAGPADAVAEAEVALRHEWADDARLALTDASVAHERV